MKDIPAVIPLSDPFPGNFFCGYETIDENNQIGSQIGQGLVEA